MQIRLTSDFSISKIRPNVNTGILVKLVKNGHIGISAEFLGAPYDQNGLCSIINRFSYNTA